MDNLIYNDGCDHVITLMGYQYNHTNYWPWSRFLDVFKTLGYKTDWLSLPQLIFKRKKEDVDRIFICWGDPTSLILCKEVTLRPGDIILQKLTSLTTGCEDENWGDNPYEWCKKWKWPLHHTVEFLYDMGVNIYGFGCRTISYPFPEKRRICNKIQHRIFNIMWGGTAFNYKQIMECHPVMNNFEYDVGYVGSIWGEKGRGNTDACNKYLKPLIKDRKYILRGHIGFNGPVSNKTMIKILQKSKICPIIHAPSWQAEKGIQDRFWTVFMSGRFGVCDNEGIYSFFEPDEVVCETDPEKYIEKSLYYMEHPEEQLPFIETVQKKIKTTCNWYVQWGEILHTILTNDPNPHSIKKMLNVKFESKYYIDQRDTNNFYLNGEEIKNYYGP